MRNEEFDSLCREVKAGENKFVQNIETLYAGKVMACGDGRLSVEAFGHRVDWDAERCQPVKHSINTLPP